MKSLSLITVSALIACFGFAAHAEDNTHTLVIKDHKFSPDTLEVPANTKIKLIVDNQDSTPEEFESHDLKLEKIISGNSKATLLVKPQKPGEYKFFGEFNEATAQGKLVVK